MKTYHVIKSLPSRPGLGLRTVEPGTEVTMSRHRSARRADTARRKYERDHHGYATFRVEIHE